MKKLSVILTGLIGLIVLFAFCLTGCTGNVNGANNSQNVPFQMPQISDVTLGPGIIWSQQNVGLWVSGEGKVKAEPDVVMLYLGVEVQKPTVAEAQRQAAISMDKVMQVLKNKGVADKDIQTQQYTIYPVKRWDEKNNNEVLIGYVVNNMVSVKIRKISDAGSVIDAVAGAASNDVRINSISFSIDDPSVYYRQAREKAVLNAVDKAKQIASAAGVKLGKVLYITESSMNIPPVYKAYDMRGVAPAPAVPETAISGGELEISVSIQMVYDID